MIEEGSEMPVLCKTMWYNIRDEIKSLGKISILSQFTIAPPSPSYLKPEFPHLDIMDFTDELLS